MIRGWKCESCNQFVRCEPWDCPGCGEETCNQCFSKYAHCEKCSGQDSDEHLVAVANANGYDFELENEPVDSQAGR